MVVLVCLLLEWYVPIIYVILYSLYKVRPCWRSEFDFCIPLNNSIVGMMCQTTALAKVDQFVHTLCRLKYISMHRHQFRMAIGCNFSEVNFWVQSQRGQTSVPLVNLWSVHLLEFWFLDRNVLNCKQTHNVVSLMPIVVTAQGCAGYSISDHDDKTEAKMGSLGW